MTILLGVIMFLGMLPGMILTAYADDPVMYLDANGSEKYCNSYTVVSGSETGANWGTPGKTKWYVATESVNISGTITLSGDVRLILCDNASLAITVSGSKVSAIRYGGTEETPAEAHLTVYGQSNGNNTGKLNITSAWCGIEVGNLLGTVSGSVTINSGAIEVTVNATDQIGGAAGISGNHGVTINGGTVKANVQGYMAPAIYTRSGNVIINGGTVIANAAVKGIFADTASSCVKITGGEVMANGQNGIQAGTVTISGGNVIASGSQYGIDQTGYDSPISIDNGNVTIIGEQGAIFGKVRNSIVGTGWVNSAGTQGEEHIPVSQTARGLSFKKLHFIPYADITTLPTAGAITYGQTLANSILNGGSANVEGNFTWKYSTAVPAVCDSQTTEYDVLFTPKDADNYAAVECKVKLTVNKAKPSVTAPTARTLTYTGSAQALVETGSTNDGTLYYAVTTENQAPTDESFFTTSIPTATSVGTYYVWYKVKGDENHFDTEPAVIPVTISGGTHSVVGGNPEIPKTGDGGNLSLWLMLFLMGLAGLAFIFRRAGR